jgi:VWFA-related protein
MLASPPTLHQTGSPGGWRIGLAFGLALAVTVTIGMPVWLLAKKHPKKPTSAGQFELHAETQLVNLTIVATDRKGQPVTNLKAGDVIVRENGTPQTLLSFEPAIVPTASGGPASIPTNRGAAVPPRAPSPSRTVTSRHICFVMDDGSTNYLDIQQAIQATAKWIREHQSPTDQVGLFSVGTSVRIWQPFTSDRGLLLEKLQDMVRIKAAESEDDRVTELLRDLGSCKGVGGNQCGMEAVSTFAQRDRALLLDRITALRALINVLGLFPGDKRIVYFSDGMLLDPGRFAAYAFGAYFGMQAAREEVMDMSSPVDLRSVTDAALRANVVFYTIDAHGLRTGLFEGDASQASPPPINNPATTEFNMEYLHAPQDSLNELANETGGLAFNNGNDLAYFTDRAVGDIAGTYYASYRPTDTNLNGAYRKITIASLRRGVGVRTRAGYFALPIYEFPVRAGVLRLREKGGRELAPVEFVLNPSDLHWQGRGRKRHDVLLVSNTLLDSHHQIVDSRVQMVDAAYPEARDLSFELGWDLVAGTYAGTVKVTEEGTSNFGIVRFQISVP